jgi:hypothetical protein
MKILLQNALTKYYCGAAGDWTADPYAAFDFQHTAKALEFVHRRKLRDIQLIVRFDDPQWDETFPLPVRLGEMSQSVAC